MHALRQARRLSCFYALKEKWADAGVDRATFAYAYVAACIAIEVAVLVLVRFIDEWHVATALAVAFIAFRYIELNRVYLELLLEWEHDLSYTFERNFLLLVLNLTEFTLLGATAPFLTTPRTGRRLCPIAL